MGIPPSPAKFVLALALALLSSLTLRAQQQPTFLTPVDMEGQWLRGSVAVAQHENDGMIGINGKGTEAGYKIETSRSSKASRAQYSRWAIRLPYLPQFVLASAPKEV